MNGRIVTDVVVISLPQARCAVCKGEQRPDGRECPRCHGAAVEPFGTEPSCGHPDCDCTPPLTLIGYADDAEQQPVYICANGRHTCAHINTDDGTTTVTIASEGIGWAVLELLDRRTRIGGYVREAVIAGVPCLQIDVPRADGTTHTQYYAGSAMHSLTPTSEEVARVIATQALAPAAPALPRGHAAGTSDAPPPEPGGAR